MKKGFYVIFGDFFHKNCSKVTSTKLQAVTLLVLLWLLKQRFPLNSWHLFFLKSWAPGPAPLHTPPPPSPRSGSWLCFVSDPPPSTGPDVEVLLLWLVAALGRGLQVRMQLAVIWCQPSHTSESTISRYPVGGGGVGHYPPHFVSLAHLTGRLFNAVLN